MSELVIRVLLLGRSLSDECIAEINKIITRTVPHAVSDEEVFFYEKDVALTYEQMTNGAALDSVAILVVIESCESKLPVEAAQASLAEKLPTALRDGQEFSIQVVRGGSGGSTNCKGTQA